MENGVVRNITKGKEYKIKKLPESLQKVLEAGGLMEYAKSQLKGD